MRRHVGARLDSGIGRVLGEVFGGALSPMRPFLRPDVRATEIGDSCAFRPPHASAVGGKRPSFPQADTADVMADGRPWMLPGPAGGLRTPAAALQSGSPAWAAQGPARVAAALGGWLECGRGPDALSLAILRSSTEQGWRAGWEFSRRT